MSSSFIEFKRSRLYLLIVVFGISSAMAAVAPDADRTYVHPLEDNQIKYITLTPNTYTFRTDANPNGHHYVQWYNTYSGTANCLEEEHFYYYDDHDFSLTSSGWVRAEVYDNNWNWQAAYRWYVTVTQPNRAPGQPGSISSSNVTQTSARVSWGASNDPDGDTITYYVEYKTDWSWTWTSAGSTTSTYRNLSGLEADTVYDVRVRAYDGEFYSSWRDQENVFTTLPYQPDLIAYNISASDTTVDPGQSVTIYWTAKNQGDGSCGSSQQGVMWSTNSTISTSDTLLEKEYLGSMSAGNSSSEAHTITIPSNATPGSTYYIGVIADYDNDVTNESSESNNDDGTPVAITINIPPKPDLIAYSISVSDTTVDLGQSVTVYWTAKNQGDGSCGSSQQGVMWSTDSTISTSDTLLEKEYLGSMSAGGTSSEAHTVTIPSGATPGDTYYIGVIADYDNDITNESSETNNDDGTPVAITINLPSVDNAVILDFDPPTGTLQRGYQVTATVRVKNTGNTTRSFWVGLSFAGPESGDWPDGWYDIPPIETATLSPNQEQTVTFAFDILAWLPPGDYDAVTAVWEDYDDAQNLMVEPRYDESTISSFVLGDYSENDILGIRLFGATDIHELPHQFIQELDYRSWLSSKNILGPKIDMASEDPCNINYSARLQINVGKADPLKIEKFYGKHLTGLSMSQLILILPDNIELDNIQTSIDGATTTWAWATQEGLKVVFAAVAPGPGAPVAEVVAYEVSKAYIESQWAHATSLLAELPYETSLAENFIILAINFDSDKWGWDILDFDEFEIAFDLRFVDEISKPIGMVTDLRYKLFEWASPETTLYSILEPLRPFVVNQEYRTSAMIHPDALGLVVTTPILSVTPSNRNVSSSSGSTSFSVSNAGTGTMPWTAQVIDGASWLSITSGASGTDSGTIQASFTQNTSASSRIGTIRVTATGASGSPADVTVTQAGTGGVQQYNLTTNVQGQGSISLNPSGGVYDSGTQIELTANAASGWHFDHWEGDLAGSTNPETITMNSNKNVTAVFEQDAPSQYTLSVNIQGQGSVALTPSDGTYDSGTTVQLTANPSSGWHFVGWEGDLTGSANPTTILMGSNKSVITVFEQDAIPNPTITNIIPNSGPIGSYIKIEGTDFGSVADSVDFSGMTSDEIVSWSDTEIFCRVPDVNISEDVSLQILWESDLDSTGVSNNTISRVKLTPDNGSVTVFHYNGSSYGIPTRIDKLNASTGDHIWMPYREVTKSGERISVNGWVDNSGNLYIMPSWSGYTLWKYNSEFDTELWSYTGSTGFEYIKDVITDESDNVYVAGHVGSFSYEPGTLVKLTSSGSFIWSCESRHYTSRAKEDYTRGMALDSQHNLYRVGTNYTYYEPVMGRLIGHRDSDGAEIVSYVVPDASSAVQGIMIDNDDYIYIGYTYNIFEEYFGSAATEEERTVIQKLVRNGDTAEVIWEYCFGEIGMFLQKNCMVKHTDNSFYVAFEQRQNGTSAPGIAEFDNDGNLLWKEIFTDKEGWNIYGGIDAKDNYIYVGLNKIDDATQTQVLCLSLTSSTCSEVFDDTFEDGIINTSLWLVGGSKGGWTGPGSGNGQWYNEEITATDGYLQARATTPASANTYGSQAWTRTVCNFNDGNDWIINFTWQADIETVGQWHADMFGIEITDGRTDWDYGFYVHHYVMSGTQQLYWSNGAEVNTAQWSIYIDHTNRTATLYEGPDGTGTIHSTKPLNESLPWYLRFITAVGTSAGFPAKDCRVNVYDYSASPVCTSGLIEIGSDDFEDGEIDTSLWLYGGERRGWTGTPAGSWEWSHEEIVDATDGYLRAHVWGPYTGNTYGAEAWVRTKYNFNDGQDYLINLTWKPDFAESHYNKYFLQITDGYIPGDVTFHWQEDGEPGTTDLLFNPDTDQHGWYLGYQPSPGKLSWSIEILASGLVRLYDAPNKGGLLISEQSLEMDKPWYIKLMVNDGTSSGFGSGDAWFDLYDFAAFIDSECMYNQVSVHVQRDDGAMSNSKEFTIVTPETIYVDLANTSGMENGSAIYPFSRLQDALSIATDGDEVWVAEGFYKPDDGFSVTLGDREATFQLKNGVAIYGGFQSGIFNWDDRNPSLFETILSGDLSSNDAQTNSSDLLTEPTRAENSYHVVTGSSTNETAMIDGFTITGGNADGANWEAKGGGMLNSGSNSKVAHCVFLRNTAKYDGGGMCNYGGNPTLTHCTFSGNASYSGGGLYSYQGHGWKVTSCIFSDNWAQQGGGIMNVKSSPEVKNCLLARNSSVIYGGGMLSVWESSKPLLVNCTFNENSANATGGIYGLYDSTPTLSNCILWNNTDDGGNDESAQINGGTPVINYSCIQDWIGGGIDNISSDPLFVNPDSNDLHLLPDSPCIDTGDPISAFNLEPEPDGGRINIGAYGNTPEAACKGGLVLQSYNLVSKTRVGRTLFDYTYTMTLNNHSTVPVANVEVELLNAPATISLIDPLAGFSYIEAGESATSEDTFTLRVDVSTPIDVALISWRAIFNWVGSTSSEQTAFAMNFVLEPKIGDVTSDAVVDFEDLAKLTNYWLEDEPTVDIAPAPGGDGIVDIYDFAALAQNWMK